jgi:hypothetical protein
MVQIQDFCSDTKLNHHLSQKIKLIIKYKFNHLIKYFKPTNFILLKKKKITIRFKGLGARRQMRNSKGF